MTKKRFQKLFRSEMTKLMAHKNGAAQCIRAAANATAKNFQKPMSYQECWTAVRNAYCYPGNVPPEK